jgi:hypothetical protein
MSNWHHNTQHNDIQHNDTRRNDIQHNDTQHNDIQHNNTQQKSKQNATFSIPTLTTRQSIAMLNVPYADCQLCLVSFTCPFALSVVMLNVVALSNYV